MCCVCNGEPLAYNINYYCEQHRKDYFAPCADCENESFINEMHKVNYYSKNELKNKWVCHHCYYNYRECEECKAIVKDCKYNSNSDSVLCSHCYYEVSHIYPFNYKPEVTFFHNENESARDKHLHLGIELEVESKEELNKKDNLKFILNDCNLLSECFYLKEDGSLNNTGVEIVSHPMTYNKICFYWRELFNYLKDNYYTSSNCGMHIHIDRKYLSKRVQQNLDYILNIFTNFGEKIANRKYNIYCDYFDKGSEINDWGVGNFEDRYEAVNFANKNTIEVRIFASTVNFNDFLARVSCLMFLIEYCKKHNLKFFMKQNNNSFEKLFKKFVANCNLNN